MPKTLNAITHDDYLRAQGAQMMIRLLCSMFESDNFTPYFSRQRDGVWEKSKATTAYQWLDAVRRFTSNTFGAIDFINQESDLVLHPVFKEEKGKLIVERIEIQRKNEKESERPADS